MKNQQSKYKIATGGIKSVKKQKSTRQNQAGAGE